MAPTNRSSAIDEAPTNGAASSETRADRIDNGYLYDSFPGYNTDSARASNGRLTIPSAASGATGKSGGTRALAPDLLRGLLMMIMAFDHAALALHTWEHGTGRVSEADGQIVRNWNYTTAYIVRTLTHLCGSGFTFLLGMGIVYLGRSRTKLGWSPMRLARYFAVRCLVLTVVTVVFGYSVSGGRFWFMNAVLFALAVDYLLAGLLWLAMSKTEVLLTGFISSMRKRWCDFATNSTTTPDDSDDDGATQPLLRERESTTRAGTRESSDAHLSWSIHNILLLVLSIVTIFWNIWLSDDGGVCSADKKDISTTVTSPSNPFLRVWFWVMMEPGSHIMSGFPPMAWLSFAILGILYARIMTARPWTRQASVLGHLCAALCFFVLFVLTRILHFGNLSEGCLQTADQAHHPKQNPYLASVASFFYVVKYPPDVAFFALTMAGNLVLLAAFTAIPPTIGKRFTILLDFGTSALFFYIVHMLALFGFGALVVSLFGHDTGIADPMNPENSNGIDNLLGYFGFWAAMMLLLWPVCRAYSRFKSTKGADSLWRFF
jgi:uncharacterized membrane protein